MTMFSLLRNYVFNSLGFDSEVIAKETIIIDQTLVYA